MVEFSKNGIERYIDDQLQTEVANSGDYQTVIYSENYEFLMKKTKYFTKMTCTFPQDFKINELIKILFDRDHRLQWDD